MPDTIRKRCGKTHPWRGRFAQGGAALAILLPDPARAQSRVLHPISDYFDAFASMEGHEFAALTLSLGVVLFAVATAIALLRNRARAARELAACHSQINELREERDRASALLLAEPQVIVVWPAGGETPEITGDVSILLRTPLPRRVLAFGTWLVAEQAHAMEDAVDALRTEGKGFSLALTTLQQRHVRAEGRAIGGRAVLRIRDLTGAQSELAELSANRVEHAGDLLVLRDVAWQDEGVVAEGARQFLDIFFQAFALISESQFGTRLVPGLRNGPRD